MPPSTNPNILARALDPALLEFDAQLDLLVDDELPENQRTQLLQSLAQAPQHWQSLATRFLERQTERKAVRQLIAGAALPGAREILPPSPFRSRPAAPWPTLRNVAALLLVAALSGIGGMQLARNSPAPDRPTDANLQDASMTTLLPGNILGADSAGSIPVQVPLLAQGRVPANYLLSQPTPPDQTASRHLVIAPWNRNRAVIFPVTTPNTAEFH